MKTLVYNPDGIISPLLLSVLKELTEEDGELYHFVCNGFFNGCSYNLTGNKAVCAYCQKKRRLVEKNLQFKSNDYFELEASSYETSIKDYDYPNFYNFSSLTNIKIDDIDLGYATLSTVVNDFREYKVEKYNSKQREITKKILKSAYSYYDISNSLLHNIKPDKVIIFNGRLVSTRPLLRLCNVLSIPCYVYEICGTGDKVNIFKNVLPHDSSAYFKKATEYYNSLELESAIKKANSFYHNKRTGINKTDLVYTDKQDHKQFNLKIPKNKKIISFFNSSPDELIGIGNEYAIGLFPSQAIAIEETIKNTYQANIHFFLRIHPNLEGVNSDDVKELLSLKNKYSNLSVIEPESSVSSYLLLDSSDAIVTFGSSIGIEATFHGKTSILLNHAIWDEFDIAYIPKDKNTFFSMCKDTLTPKPKENTYPIALYLLEYGEKLKYYSGSYKYGALVNNKSVEPSFFYKLSYLIYKLHIQLISKNKIQYRKLKAKISKYFSFL